MPKETPGQRDRPQTSTRDLGELRDRLEAWLADRLAGPTVSDLVVPSSTGMSSETVLFDVLVQGEARPRRLVARIAPDPAADPVFPDYDMARQFATMALVAEHTAVPVPQAHWLETDTGPLGAPFFVMDRVEGLVPPDVMPYTFGDNWLFDASAAARGRLERSTVEVLAALHALSADGPAGVLAGPADGRTPLRHHVAGQRRYYEWVAGDGTRSPLIEAGFAWLEEHWPAEEGAAVLSWGDARIGNVLYRECAPVAVLDWEMASVGPREIDLGWLVYMHRFFQDLAEGYGLPGLPDLLRRGAVATAYEDRTGHRPTDLDFYTAYAALRYAVISFRIARRQATFGEAPMPEDPDHAIMGHQQFRAMLEGTYWERVPGA